MVYNDSKSPLFNLPAIRDHNDLTTCKQIANDKYSVRRFGFHYFAPELTTENALNHANYCIYCHNQQKDSCSKGLKLSTKKLTNDF